MLLQRSLIAEIPCKRMFATKFASNCASDSLVHSSSCKKREHEDELLGPETARWGGGLPREGVVAEKFVPALESLSSLGFEESNLGCAGNFAGMSRTPGGVQKVCAKKVRAHFSLPASSDNLYTTALVD